MATFEIFIENGVAGCRCSFDRAKEPVVLNQHEAAALSIIKESLPESADVRVERRTDSYLTLITGEYGDFCRLKATDRAKWVSLDLWNAADEIKKDDRLQIVKNQNQRHWKIPLSCVADLEQYSFFINAAYSANKEDCV